MVVAVVWLLGLVSTKVLPRVWFALILAVALGWLTVNVKVSRRSAG